MNAFERLYPEAAVGGYSRVDGTVEFYSRIAALLREDMTVVDFGAGRGAYLDQPPSYRRDLQEIRGRVSRFIGVDVDPEVLGNPGLDEAILYEPPLPIDLPAESVDLVVSDFTFEHLEDPATASAELRRILRPGGWICARTPNRRGYIAVMARAIPRRLHARVLRRAQPERQLRDVFPASYQLNTRSQVARHFPPPEFETFSYAVNPEPAYFGDSLVGWRAMQALSSVLPQSVSAQWLFFIRKRPAP